MTTREFEFQEGTSDKFWKITLDGDEGGDAVGGGRQGRAGRAFSARACRAGAVSVMTRDLSDDPAVTEPRPFHRLADTPITQRAGPRQIGASQLVVARAKRAPSGALTIGRSRCSLSPQGYVWEQLRVPVLVDDIAGLTITPSAVVFEEAGRRTVVQPWVDRAAQEIPSSSHVTDVPALDPIAAHLADLHELLGSLLLSGPPSRRRDHDPPPARRLAIRRSPRPRPSTRARRPPRRAGRDQATQPRRDPTPASSIACDLFVLLRLAQELV